MDIKQASCEVIDADRWRSDESGLASNKFKSDGCLILKNVFKSADLKKYKEISLSLIRDFDNQTEADVSAYLEVGDRRYMIPMPIGAGLDQRSLFTRPALYSFLTANLGKDFILNGFGCVMALQGAPDQEVHKDHPSLFGSPIDDFLPVFAVTVMVPLIDLSELTGTTRVWKGSHLIKYFCEGDNGSIFDRPYFDPYLRSGDCLVMDYRLYHGGLANRSGTARPVLYMMFSRPWFRDYKNYRKHSPLTITQDEINKVPAEYHHLFAHI